jgi:hypothetical protein
MGSLVVAGLDSLTRAQLDLLASQVESLRSAVPDTIRDTIWVGMVDHPFGKGANDGPVWLGYAFTAIAAVAAGVFAQWFRVYLDGKRRREQVRRVVYLEAVSLRVYLNGLDTAADTWNVPLPESAFWKDVENAMRGFDQLYVDLVLLPDGVRVPTALWFHKVRSLAGRAAGLARRHSEDIRKLDVSGQIHGQYVRRFEALRSEVAFEIRECDKIAEALHELRPRNHFKQWLLTAQFRLEGSTPPSPPPNPPAPPADGATPAPEPRE